MKNELNLAESALEKLTDDELKALKFVMPWQMDEISTEENDPDFASTSNSNPTREKLQQTCWTKFNENPQVGTAVKGQVGRLAGYGFEVSSDIPEIQEVLERIELDPRNRLYTFWPKYVARSIIEGELFLLVTMHEDGFAEIDFLDPSNITGGGEDGIIYHPTKSTMPLYYFVKVEDQNNSVETTVLIPSIYIARYPELAKEAAKVPTFLDDLTKASKSSKAKFKSIGGYNRFIISWDKGFVTKRNVSYLRTILEWLNHYENLKKYEIDHKKSAGSYLWVITMEDAKTFRSWLSLSDAERSKTGIMAKKTPGGTMVLPPGMKMEVMNPSLPTISESDTDIFHMITSGLNEPEDVTSGQSKGTFASVKASRGPMADRIADEVSSFEKFLRYDFYSNIFYLMNKIVNFPNLFTQKVAVDFKNQEPVFRNVKKKPEQLVSICFPTSETNDAEATARAFLGVKHGSTYEVLGIPNEEIAKKMGFANYRRLRLAHATEMEKYPELMLSVDQASVEGTGIGKKKEDEEPTGSTNQDSKTVVKPTLKVKPKEEVKK